MGYPLGMQPTRNDRVRQVTVTLAEVFCVLGTLVGVGVLGTEVNRTSGGALSADATLLAPAGPAFSIWSVIYAGLAAYTLWQWLPARTTDPRVRATGWLAAVSMVLNATWLLVTQAGWIWVSVLVILALLATLVELVRRLTAHAPSSVVERVVLDGTFGLYLGWVSVAVCANIFAAATDSGYEPGPGLAVGVLVLVGAAAVAYAYRLGARIAVAAAIAWGLCWLAYGRVADEPPSDLVAVVALLAAAVALGAPLSLRRLTRRGVRRDLARL